MARYSRRLRIGLGALALTATACGDGGKIGATAAGDGDGATPSSTSDAGTTRQRRSQSDPPRFAEPDAGSAADPASNDPTKSFSPSDASIILPPQLQPDSVCGNGIRGSNEECDDGNSGDAGDTDMCTNACTVQAVPVAPITVSSGDTHPARYLGIGRHPVAAGDDGFAVTFLEPDEEPLRISLATFDEVGERGPVVDISAGTGPLFFSDPVVAELPDGAYAVAYTEFGGDGDGLGIALRRVSGSTVSTVRFANAGTLFSQYDPDILWTGTELIVAWTDDSDLVTGPDVKYRRFDENLKALDGIDQVLGGTTGNEGKVSLIKYKTGWAAAWRVGTGEVGLEQIAVKAGVNSWLTQPALPGPAEDHPTPLELDANHLFVLYTVNGDNDLSGVANFPKGAFALLDTAAPGDVVAYISPDNPGGFNIPVDQHAAVGVPNGLDPPRIYTSFRIPSAGEKRDELYYQEVEWIPPDAVEGGEWLPYVLPQSGPEGEPGDQRRLGLAATPLAPEGAVVGAYETYFAADRATQGEPDVMVQLMPVPFGIQGADAGGGS